MTQAVLCFKFLCLHSFIDCVAQSDGELHTGLQMQIPCHVIVLCLDTDLPSNHSILSTVMDAHPAYHLLQRFFNFLNVVFILNKFLLWPMLEHVYYNMYI